MASTATAEPEFLAARRERGNLAARQRLAGEKGHEESVDLSLEPTQLVPVPDEGEAKKVLRLLEAIDDHDDVQAVHSNADIPDEVLATFEG